MVHCSTEDENSWRLRTLSSTHPHLFCFVCIPKLFLWCELNQATVFQASLLGVDAGKTVTSFIVL